MKKARKNGNILKIAIAIIIICIIMLFKLSNKLIKKSNNEQMALTEFTFEDTNYDLEPPIVSAGMIPVKKIDGIWVITTKEDASWYDYANGKPAYMMLNDGVYQSELIQDMTGKRLASDNVGIGIDLPEDMGTIYAWIPRFAVNNETNSIKYLPAEMQPGGNWKVPDMFMYKVNDEKKADFSLNGIWIGINEEVNYQNIINEMQKENSIYGFLANTKASQITTADINTSKKFIELSTMNMDLFYENTNNIILKIINVNKVEPIKAKIVYDKEKAKIQISVTYTKNGIKEILDEHKEKLTFIETNGVIQANMEDLTVGTGTYYFTVVDNSNNKKDLNIYIETDSLFDMIFIPEIDSMDNQKVYDESQNVPASNSSEYNLLNKLKQDSGIKFNRAYRKYYRDYSRVTAIAQETRNDEDLKYYIYKKYEPKILSTSYYVSKQPGVTIDVGDSKKIKNFGYSSYSINKTSGIVTFSNKVTDGKNSFYSSTTTLGESLGSTSSDFYYYEFYEDISGTYLYYRYKMKIKTEYRYGNSQNLISNEVALDGTYENNKYNDSDGYWYVRFDRLPKYTLYQYEGEEDNLILKSKYDVDTETITTEPIDISNKGKNKVKLFLDLTSTYKIYISEDNTIWKEVMDVKWRTPKELDVEGWDKLYVKIETQFYDVFNMYVSYYKD